VPIEVEKEVTTKKSGLGTDQVSQTETVTKVPTMGEVKDAKADRGNAWIWYIVGIIDLLLVLRLVFLLFGAQSVGFADLLYTITNPLIAPFRGIFPAPAVDGSYFDTASLVAIIVYVLIGWVIARLIDLATRPTTSKKV
jgi:uncharacterized protein YggT (Ycf19 family)